jgi:hypothetical protein
VVGYVVMPDHIHLLISEPGKGDPSRVDAGDQAGFFAAGLEGGAQAASGGTAGIISRTFAGLSLYKFHIDKHLRDE